MSRRIDSKYFVSLGSTAPPSPKQPLAIFLMGFEFVIVSLLPLAAHLVPGSTGRGLGLSVGAGTFGRAAFSIPAAALYDAHGFMAPTLLGTAAALIASLLTLGFIRDKR